MATPEAPVLPDGGEIDPTARRRFLKQAAVGGAASGALWLAPAVVASVPAFAVGTVCTTGGAIDWAAMTPPGSPGEAALAAGWTVGTFGSTQVRFQIADPAARLVYGGAGIYTGVQPTQPDGGFIGLFAMLMDHAAFDDTATLTITFSKKITNLRFSIVGLTLGGNGTDGYVDHIDLTAYNNYGNVGGVQATVPITATPGSAVSMSTSGNTVSATGTVLPCNPCTSTTLGVVIAGRLDALVVDYSQFRNVTSQHAINQYVGITDLSWSC